MGRAARATVAGVALGIGAVGLQATPAHASWMRGWFVGYCDATLCARVGQSDAGSATAASQATYAEAAVGSGPSTVGAHADQEHHVPADVRSTSVSTSPGAVTVRQVEQAPSGGPGGRSTTVSIGDDGSPVLQVQQRVSDVAGTCVVAVSGQGMAPVEQPCPLDLEVPSVPELLPYTPLPIPPLPAG